MIIPRRDVVVDFTVKKDKNGVVLNPEVLSKTSQSEKDTVDINKIMKNHNENGGLIGDPFRRALTEGLEKGSILDLSRYGDYREIKTRAAAAENLFSLVPPDVRVKRFGNDPQAFFEFLADQKNDKEAVELGLKDAEVLKTAISLDGKTRVTPEQLKQEKAAAAAKQGAGTPAPGQA